MAILYICDRCKSRQAFMSRVDMSTLYIGRNYADLCCECRSELSQLVTKFLQERK